MTWKTRFAEIVATRAISAELFAEADALRRQNLPTSLYKYRQFDRRNLETMLAGKVWAASPTTFNDPFDSAVLFDSGTVVDEIRTDARPSPRGKSLAVRLIQGESFGLPSAFRDELVSGLTSLYDGIFCPFVERASQRLRTHLRVCCLTSRGDNIPMWTHYAAQFTGFCVRWDLSTWHTHPEVVDKLLPVVYDHQPYRMPHLALNPPFKGAEVLLALRKAADWSYEDEWRYVELGGEPGGGRLVELPRPVAVHLGPLMKPEERAILVEACAGIGVATIVTRLDRQRGRLVAE